MLSNKILKEHAESKAKTMSLLTKVCRELLKSRQAVSSLIAAKKYLQEEVNSKSIRETNLRKTVTKLDNAIISLQNKLDTLTRERRLHREAANTAVAELDWWRDRALCAEKLAYERLTIMRDKGLTC